MAVGRFWRRYVAVSCSFAAILVVATLYRWESHTSSRDLTRAAARLSWRPLEVRLSGFEYRPYVPQVGFDQRDSILRSSPGLAAVAGKILSGPRETFDAEGRHQTGVAALVSGRYREAIKGLESATDLDATNGAIWNDLAGARYSASRALDDPYLMVEALAAVHRSITLGTPADHSAAYFNEALILESLGLHKAAQAAYSRVIGVDEKSEWLAEALSRRARLQVRTQSEEWDRARPKLERAALIGDRQTVQQIVGAFPQPSRTWSETVYLKQWGDAVARKDAVVATERLRIVDSVAEALSATNGDTMVRDIVAAIRNSDKECALHIAQAHQLYYDARLLYQQRDVAKSMPMFQEVQRVFSECRSPMREVAAYYVSSAQFDAGQTLDAEKSCRRLLSASVPGHRVLRAQILWTFGNIQTRQGMLHQALSSQRQALAEFQRAGEALNTSAMERQVAGTLAVLGHRTEAWRLRIANFAQISRLGDDRELQSALDIAARTEAFDERWDTALPLLALAADTRLQINPRVYASTLVWYALAEQHFGISSGRERLDAAERAAGALRDPAMRQRAKADLMLVEAIGIVSREPRRAAALLDGYIRDAATYNNLLFIPEAYLQRALARRALGQNEDGERDLRETLRLLSDRKTRPIEQRLTYFRTADIATRELVDLMVRRGAIAEALGVLDDARAASFGVENAARHALGTRDESGLLVEYVTLANELLVFASDVRGVRATYVQVSEEKIKETSQQFIEDILHDADGSAASRLGHWLLSAVAEQIGLRGKIFIVPDGVLKRVPFGALRMADGRYLVDHAEIVVLPTKRLAGRGVAGLPDSVVAVGNPFLDGALSELPPLPNAAHEATLVARGYRHAKLFTGRMATSGNVLGAARDASLLHFAVHAVVVPAEASKSYLALASAPGSSGVLSLEDIARAELTASPIVVLAGCRTADMPDRVPKGFSLAEGFLAAGASTVVATLWDLPDDLTSEDFAVRFHRALRAGDTPAAAVRAAQLGMLHSTDPRRRRRAAWCVFQVYGGD
jgi:CHAT domain-containing protein